MAVITVERQLIYAEAKNYSVDFEKAKSFPQVHLRVRCIRVPWGQGVSRTIGYMDDAHFGGFPELKQFIAEEPHKIKDFFLGVGHAHPKLIVADVQMSDLYSRPEICKKLGDKYKQGLASETFPEHPLPSRFEEGVWDRLTPEEKIKYYRPPGSRVRWRKDRPKQFPYKFEYPNIRGDEVWLLVDPTSPGREGITHRTAVELAKRYLGREVNPELFKGMSGDSKIFDMTGITVLGVGYLLRYWTRRYPPDQVLWLESVQQRVRTYLTKALRRTWSFTPAYSRIDTEKTWYAMGVSKIPPLSQRYMPTASGRIRNYMTFEPGVGFKPPDFRGAKSEVLKPLFTVKARNRGEATLKANQKIKQLVDSTNPRENALGAELVWKWSAGGHQVIPRVAVAYLQKTQPP